MSYENIRAGDVDLRVGFEWGNLNLARFFPEATGDPMVTLNVNVFYPLGKGQPTPEYSDRVMNCWIQGEDGRGLDYLHIVRHVGYLAGDVSERYRFCHAAGLKINGKGVMLIGNSGNGKSTLASKLEGEILDDDILLASPTEIRRISNVGGRMNPERGTVELIEDGNYQSPLGFVFLLNNQYDPDHVVEIQPSEVNPEMTFDDTLHPYLLGAYRQRMPIAFEVPVFEVGTKRDPDETTRVIERIVSG